MGVLIWLQLVSRCSDLLDWAIIYKARQASVCIGRTRATGNIQTAMLSFLGLFVSSTLVFESIKFTDVA
jgi:hypothetical protein